MFCPLCRKEASDPKFEERGQKYYHCSECGLYYLDEDHWIPLGQEKARYELHRNTDTDEGYLNHLNPLRTLVQKSYSKGTRGLDYGCGKNPVLTHLLQRDGFDIDPYDPLFQFSCPIERNAYDFIFSCEAFEHFHNVDKEILCIRAGLKPGGQLFVQTMFFHDPDKLQKSRYLRDETHVCFYGEPSFEWIAKKYRFEVSFPLPNIAVLTKED